MNHTEYKICYLYFVRLHTSLGSGQFGEVHKATWSIGKQKMELAVKTLKSGASEEDQVKFLQEAAIMGQFSHNNVIKMYGVVTLGEPVSYKDSCLLYRNFCYHNLGSLWIYSLK